MLYECVCKQDIVSSVFFFFLFFLSFEMCTPCLLIIYTDDLLNGKWTTRLSFSSHSKHPTVCTHAYEYMCSALLSFHPTCSWVRCAFVTFLFLVRIRTENVTHQTFVNRICRTKGHASKMLIEPEKWDAWSWICRGPYSLYHCIRMESKHLVRSRVDLVNLHLVLGWKKQKSKRGRETKRKWASANLQNVHEQTYSYRLFWNRHFSRPGSFAFLLRFFQFTFFSVFHLLKVVLRIKWEGKK